MLGDNEPPKYVPNELNKGAPEPEPVKDVKKEMADLTNTINDRKERQNILEAKLKVEEEVLTKNNTGIPLEEWMKENAKKGIEKIKDEINELGKEIQENQTKLDKLIRVIQGRINEN